MHTQYSKLLVPLKGGGHPASCLLQGHRLVLLAEQSGKASEAEDLLFEAIYEKGMNVSDITVLEQLGEQLHLSGVTYSGSCPFCTTSLSCSLPDNQPCSIGHMRCQCTHCSHPDGTG